MTKVKIGKKEYKIYYAMQPTVQSGILKTLASLESDKEFGIESIGELLTTMTELLLVGLQKFHSDEFGYNYMTGEGKDEAMSKVFSLMDDMAADESDDADYFVLYNTLQNEMLENGFFAKLFRQEKQKAEKKAEQ